jgi:glycosyltransferase involved in cell wall biosynthesis
MVDAQSHIAVVIPALNEESALPRVLADLPQDLLTEVVVVDNGSIDRTAAVARAGGATVVSEDRRGYGWACLAGIAHLAGKTPPDIVVFLDADHSDYPQELAMLVLPIMTEGYDLVIGSRPRRAEPGALLPHVRFGNALATLLIRFFYGFTYSDLGPFRAIRFQSLVALGMQDKTYGWTVEMQVKAIQHGLRITEAQVRYRKRSSGKSKVGGTITGTVLAGYKILWTVMRYAWRTR